MATRAVGTRLVWVLWALLSTAFSCHGGGENTPEASDSGADALPLDAATPDQPPAVALIEVQPPAVMVNATPGQSLTFSVKARLKTSDGKVIPESQGYVPIWISSNPVVSIDRAAGHSAILKVEATATPPWQAVVTAKVGDHQSNPGALIEGIPDAAAGEDRIRATHIGDSPPTAALVRGQPEGGGACLEDWAIAFVRAASPGKLVRDCGASKILSVFSAGQAAHVRDVTWDSGDNAEDVGTSQKAPLEVPIALWIALPGDDNMTDLELQALWAEASEQALDDIDLANALLTSSRTGVAVRLTTPLPGVVNDRDALREVFSFGCLQAAAGNPDPTNGVLNVFYVARVYGSARGMTCPRDDQRSDDVIYVSWPDHSPPTLAHELAHAMSLLFPYDGHTEGVPGFESTNLMTGYLPDEEAAERSDLTLGQAFRISVDDWSWVNHAVSVPGGNPVRGSGEPTLPCQCDPQARQPCPGLLADVIPHSGDGEPVPGWACADVVVVVGSDLTHKGVGLMAGRDWRSGQCRADAVGDTTRLWGYPDLFLLFPNFTYRGSCDAWLAMLLRDHSLLYTNTPGDFAFLSDRLDYLGVTMTPGPPLELGLKVWFVAQQGGMAAVAANDFAWAQEILTENRTGLRVKAVFETTIAGGSDACSLSPFTNHAINVYYVPSGHPLESQPKGWCRQGNTHFILIPTGPTYCKTVLAHRLGHVLSLSDVSGDGFDATNLMWYPPGTTECDTRKRLTLGQAFRMNVSDASWLNLSTASPRLGQPTVGCGVNSSTRCPSVSVDVPR